MTIIGFILTVALVGLILWAVLKLVPMPAEVGRFLTIGVIVILVIWLLSILGVGNIPMPRLGAH